LIKLWHEPWFNYYVKVNVISRVLRGMGIKTGKTEFYYAVVQINYFEIKQ